MNILLPTTDPAPHNNSNVQHCAAAEYLAFSAAATVPLVGRQSPQQTSRAPRRIPQVFLFCFLTLGKQAHVLKCKRRAANIAAVAIQSTPPLAASEGLAARE